MGEIHPYIERIQKIAKGLSEAHQNLSDFENLSLQNNLERIRLIANPMVTWPSRPERSSIGSIDLFQFLGHIYK